MRSIVMSMSIYVSVCPSVCLTGYLLIPRAIFTNVLCMLPMSVAPSSSGTVIINRIAYQREGVTGLHIAGEV